MVKYDSHIGPTFEFEEAMARLHGGPVAGIDEAGRGPWAGPVVAAAVILYPDNIPVGLNDSKKLSAKARDRLYEEIMESAHVGVGVGDVGLIDTDNILRATLWAMAQAFEALPSSATSALIDGNKSPDLPCPAECLIKGDGRSFSIAAASIIAKVTRDRMMVELADVHPGYGWERNKGYGTAEHQAALTRLGVTPHHRRSFKPVKLVIEISS